MNILLVDDDESIGFLVEYVVTNDGYDFLYAPDAAAAVELMREHPVDLALIDVMMPGMDGFELCRVLRKSHPDLPIIFLTAKSDIADKQIAFEAGCDDYLTKPFVSQELSLRIRALLRRAGTQAFPTGDGVLRYRDLSIDVKRRKVEVAGRVVELTPKEFALLRTLAEHPGEVFTKKRLTEEVWGTDFIGETSNVAVFVRHIREKIETDPSNPAYVQTVWHVGYRLGD